MGTVRCVGNKWNDWVEYAVFLFPWTCLYTVLERSKRHENKRGYLDNATVSSHARCSKAMSPSSQMTFVLDAHNKFDQLATLGRILVLY